MKVRLDPTIVATSVHRRLADMRGGVLFRGWPDVEVTSPMADSRASWLEAVELGTVPAPSHDRERHDHRVQFGSLSKNRGRCSLGHHVTQRAAMATVTVATA